jgi:hypothetical protein
MVLTRDMVGIFIGDKDVKNGDVHDRGDSLHSFGALGPSPAVGLAGCVCRLDHM